MSSKKKFRIWWQPPRVAGDRLSHRQVSFLELFYDLVYVALIAQLAHYLVGHMDWAGFGSFAFLFFIVWWAWFNGTTYHDLHGNNDIRTRVFTFIQMFSVVSMAVFAHGALGEGATGFALSYAFFYLILTYMWWRTGVYDPNHKVLSLPYSMTFLAATIIFIISIFIRTPVRFYLWAFAILLTFIELGIIMKLGERNPKLGEQLKLSSTVSPSLVERMGLFTIIVLGEVIIGIVSGLAGSHDLNWNVGVIGALGVLVGIGLWWLYFDVISQNLPIQDPGKTMLWSLLHLPVTIGITTIGAVLVNTIEHEGVMSTEGRWLIVASISATLVSIVLLSTTLQIPSEHRKIHSVGRKYMLLSAVLVIIPALFSMGVLWLLIISALLLLSPVFFALRLWIAQHNEAQHNDTH